MPSAPLNALLRNPQAIEHFRSRQRHHDEERAGRAHREQADQERDEAAGDDRRREREVRAAARRARSGRRTHSSRCRAGRRGRTKSARRSPARSRLSARMARIAASAISSCVKKPAKVCPTSATSDERDADRAADEGRGYHHQPDTEKRRAGISPLGRKIRTSAITR